MKVALVGLSLRRCFGIVFPLSGLPLVGSRRREEDRTQLHLAPTRGVKNADAEPLSSHHDVTVIYESNKKTIEIFRHESVYIYMRRLVLVVLPTTVQYFVLRDM